MRFSKEQIKKFQSIHAESYGTHIGEEKAEELLIEITQLLETVISINNESAD